MTKNQALRLALEYVELVPDDRYNADHIDRDALITTIKTTLEAKDEPVGSFMTRLQAIDFLLKMRPQTEPTEKQIIATIDAYSALFGDMIESPTPTQRKSLTDEEIQDALEVEFLGSNLKRNWQDDLRVARAIEAAHGIKGEA